MNRSTIGIAVLAAIATSLPAEAAQRRADGSAQTTVIGLTDAQLCVLETQRENIGEAFYWCDRTIRRGEASIEARAVAHMHRGVLFLKTHDIEAAMAAIDRAIELAPVFGDAYLNRGNALFALGRTEEAVAAYDTALEQGCTTPELVHYNRAKAYEKLGRTAEAEADLAAARRMMPEDSPLAGRISRR